MYEVRRWGSFIFAWKECSVLGTPACNSTQHGFQQTLFTLFIQIEKMREIVKEEDPKRNINKEMWTRKTTLYQNTKRVYHNFLLTNTRRGMPTNILHHCFLFILLRKNLLFNFMIQAVFQVSHLICGKLKCMQKRQLISFSIHLFVCLMGGKMHLYLSDLHVIRAICTSWKHKGPFCNITPTLHGPLSHLYSQPSPWHL